MLTLDTWYTGSEFGNRNLRPWLLPLNNRSQRLAVNYQGRRIGVIRHEIDLGIAETELQYGACQNKLDNKILAQDWVYQNYLRVKNSDIKFDISENFAHCTLECGYILIKIDSQDEDYLATIQNNNILSFEYFPYLRDAITFSFNLILNPMQTNLNSDAEF